MYLARALRTPGFGTISPSTVSSRPDDTARGRIAQHERAAFRKADLEHGGEGARLGRAVVGFRRRDARAFATGQLRDCWRQAFFFWSASGCAAWSTVDHWFAAPKEPVSGAEAPSNRVIRRAAAASSSAAKKLSPYRWAVAGLATAAVVAADDFVVGMRGAGLETFIKNKTPERHSAGHRARVFHSRLEPPAWFSGGARRGVRPGQGSLVFRRARGGGRSVTSAHEEPAPARPCRRPR